MPFLVVIATILAVAVFFVDAFVNFDIAVAVLYVAVVLMSGSFLGQRGILMVGVACALLTLIGFTIQHGPVIEDESIGRAMVSLLAITITTILTVRIQLTTANWPIRRGCST